MSIQKIKSIRNTTLYKNPYNEDDGVHYVQKDHILHINKILNFDTFSEGETYVEIDLDYSAGQWWIDITDWTTNFIP